MSELKKIKEVPMLGFEHPSHMVTHPSTDEAQCCFNLKKSTIGMTKIHKWVEEE